jgi:F0F1-type ATP synthase membrane subunit b/b'
VDEVSAQVGGLVLSVARQVIGREIDAEAHRGLIDEAVAALRASADDATVTRG